MKLSTEFIQEIVKFIESEKPDKKLLSRKKNELCKKYGLKKIPTDIQLLTNLSNEEEEKIKKYLQTKPMRTGSGVTVVAVMTKPMPCPHGKCTYCPGGPNSFFGDTPQSYTGYEPATMRGKRAGYDAYIQVFNRLEQYIVTGHNPEKVELILMGGTFPSYPIEYQDEVIKDIFKAMNDFSELFYDNDKNFLFDKFKDFFELPGEIKDKKRTKTIQKKILEIKKINYDKNNIKELQSINENSIIRCIGITIETRPTEGRKKHGLLMLEQGCTRVELGIQTTFDDVLKEVHRDHTVQDSINSVRELRDLGFKLNFHIMLGLPLMNPERDIESLKRIFTDPDFKPDMIKIYPCMVMPGTPLYYDYKVGKYTPYNTKESAEIITKITPYVPEYVRVMRVQRDIPTKVTAAGVDKTNLRQYVDKERNKEHIVSRDIRSREIGKNEIKDYDIKVTQYDASRGKEFFIQLYETNIDKIIGFCRLRFPSQSLHPVITNDSAIIRELHVYGSAIGVYNILNSSKQVFKSEFIAQHKGFGMQLVEKAESICRYYNKKKLIVISGVGVRQYYKKKHGFIQDGPYVSKLL